MPLAVPPTHRPKSVFAGAPRRQAGRQAGSQAVQRSDVRWALDLHCPARQLWLGQWGWSRPGASRDLVLARATGMQPHLEPHSVPAGSQALPNSTPPPRAGSWLPNIPEGSYPVFSLGSQPGQQEAG